MECRDLLYMAAQTQYPPNTAPNVYTSDSRRPQGHRCGMAGAPSQASRPSSYHTQNMRHYVTTSISVGALSSNHFDAKFAIVMSIMSRGIQKFIHRFIINVFVGVIFATAVCLIAVMSQMEFAVSDQIETIAH